jgi:hypothetical protein
LLASVIAGSLIASSSMAAAQVGAPALEPATEAALGSNGESALRGGRSDAITAIIFGLIIFTIAVWVGRDNDPDIAPPPASP